MSNFILRNHSCRIREITINGLRAVILENELLRVGILVDKGTDIFEFLYKPKDTDCMWQSWLGIRANNDWHSTSPPKHGSFIDYYFGGWQELFPNTDEACEYKGAELGIHGEVCLLPWDFQIIQDFPEIIKVKFFVKTIRTPYFLEKTITLKSKSPVLEFDEKITNLSNEKMDFMWGFHPALGEPFLSEECHIILPSCRVRSDAILGFDHSRISFDHDNQWPHIPSTNENLIDLRKVPSKVTNSNDRVYIYDFNEGWYIVENQKTKIAFSMSWDKEIFPYILYWQSFGGWYGYPFYGTAYTISLEPRSSFPFPLSRVIENNTQKKLDPKASIKTHYTASLTHLEGNADYVNSNGKIFEK